MGTIFCRSHEIVSEINRYR